MLKALIRILRNPRDNCIYTVTLMNVRVVMISSVVKLSELYYLKLNTKSGVTFQLFLETDRLLDKSKE